MGEPQGILELSEKTRSGLKVLGPRRLARRLIRELEEVAGGGNVHGILEECPPGLAGVIPATKLGSSFSDILSDLELHELVGLSAGGGHIGWLV